MRETYSSQEIDKEFVYSEIIAENLLKNSWWTLGTSEWEINSGYVEVEEDESGYMNLTMDSNISSQLKQEVTLKPNRHYFVMFDVCVTRYVKGLFGLHFNGRFKSGNSDFGLRRLSKGYETIIGTLQTPANWLHPQLIFSGSIHEADGAGSIRCLSLYDLTELYGEGKEPEADEFFSILTSRQDEKGLYLSIRETFTMLNNNINKKKNKVQISDEAASKLFFDELKKKTQILEMGNTFLNNNGDKKEEHLSTSRDIVKLGFHASGYKKILSIWGRKRYPISILGINARKIDTVTSLRGKLIDQTYSILGGVFDEMISENLNLVALLTDSEGELYLASVMGISGKNRKADCYEAMRQLIDIAKLRKKIPSYQSTDVFKAKSGSIIIMPKGDPHFYIDVPPKSIYSINENQSIPSASITKLINALVVLDYVQNLHETFEIKKSDIMDKSDLKFYEGDVISFWDALHILLLYGTNTISKALSRVIGHKIFKIKGYVD